MRASPPVPHLREPAMPIELPKDARSAAIQSIERYFDEQLQQRIGNIQAAALLNFFLQEVAPSIYNTAIADAQERLLARVQELDIECRAGAPTLRQKKKGPHGGGPEEHEGSEGDGGRCGSGSADGRPQCVTARLWHERQKSAR
jgi:uncharacterized protein (DUF2164 family)